MHTLDRILDAYTEARPAYRLNQLSGSLQWPTITVAGGGDPLIHPQALELLERCVERGFPTSLITNASGLTADRIARLSGAGLRSVCVSFWGIVEAEYEAAMQLPYRRTLAKVERLAAAARDTGLAMSVIWVRTPEISSTDDEVQAFWADRGIDVDLEDNHMWNRGGLLPVATGTVSDPDVRVPDENRRIWCSDLFFSDAYRWNGEAVLCCCQYFAPRPHRLGRADGADGAGVAVVARRKTEVLKRRPLPSMCEQCALPRTQRARWLAGPWLALADDEEKAMLLYEDRSAP